MNKAKLHTFYLTLKALLEIYLYELHSKIWRIIWNDLRDYFCEIMHISMTYEGIISMTNVSTRALQTNLVHEDSLRIEHEWLFFQNYWISNPTDDTALRNLSFIVCPQTWEECIQLEKAKLCQYYIALHWWYKTKQNALMWTVAQSANEPWEAVNNLSWIWYV